MCKKQEAKNIDNVLTSPLWYNNHLPCKDMYLPKWYKSEIFIIANIIHDFRSVLDMDT